MPFPVVPFALGVPPIPRDPLAAFASVALLTADAIVASFFNFGPQWGIFLDGAPVLTADSVISFDYRQDWVLSDYPLEQGAFESYDKVQVPFAVRLRFTSGGDLLARQALLDDIAAIADDTNLYDVVTPEQVYPSCNVAHYDYHRTAANGVGIIVLDVWLVQVRVTATLGAGNVQSPSAAGTADLGGVNASTPTSAQNNAVLNPNANVFGGGNEPNLASGV